MALNEYDVSIRYGLRTINETAHASDDKSARIVAMNLMRGKKFWTIDTVKLREDAPIGAGEQQ